MFALTWSPVASFCSLASGNGPVGGEFPEVARRLRNQGDSQLEHPQWLSQPASPQLDAELAIGALATA